MRILNVGLLGSVSVVISIIFSMLSNPRGDIASKASYRSMYTGNQSDYTATPCSQLDVQGSQTQCFVRSKTLSTFYYPSNSRYINELWPTFVSIGLDVMRLLVFLINNRIFGSAGASAELGIVVLGDLLVGLL